MTKRKKKRRFKGPEFTRNQTEELYNILSMLLQAFPGKFVDINPNYIELVFKLTPKSRFAANVQLVKGLRILDTDKRVTIIVHKPTWVLKDEYQKCLLIYEQLLKIYYDDKNKKYKLRRYDVQTFGEMLTDFGLRYEKAKDKFSSILTKDNVDQTA